MVLTLSEITAVLLSSVASSSVKFCLEGYILERFKVQFSFKNDYTTAQKNSPLTRDFFCIRDFTLRVKKKRHPHFCLLM